MRGRPDLQWGRTVMTGQGGSLPAPFYLMASEDSVHLPLELAQSPEPSASFSTPRPSLVLSFFIMEIRNWKGKRADGMQLAWAFCS